MKALTLVLATFAILVALPAFAGVPADLGDYVWFDADCDGTQNEGPDASINDVRVMFFRDYECNGVIDGYDEIYDYAFTHDDADGNPGYYNIPTISGFCFVAFLDPAYIPEGLNVTTDEEVAFVTPTDGFFDADFGLGSCTEEPEVPDYACPKTIGFWKQQIEQSSAKKFTRTEVDALLTYAVTLSDVFSSENDLAYSLLGMGRDGALARAKRQFAGLLLNVAAYDLADSLNYQVGLSWDNPLDLSSLTSATTVGEAIEQIQSAILAGANLGWANDTADAINNGRGIQVECVESDGGCQGRKSHHGGHHGGHHSAKGHGCHRH